MRRKMKVRIHGGRIDVWPMHLPHRPSWKAQPAIVPIERSYAVAIRCMRNRNSFLRILGKNLDGNVPVSESSRAFHHPGCKFVNRTRASDSLQVFFEELFGGWSILAALILFILSFV